METRIIIAGSRDFNDYDYLKNSVNKIVLGRGIHRSKIRIISGTAKGADSLGELLAKRNNLMLSKFPADWKSFGKRAGYIRNEQMAKFAIEDGNYGMLIAFWYGESRGTKNMIEISNRYKLEVHVVKF